MSPMRRKHLLAAEVYGYSYDHYQDHLEARNVRFTRMMPDDIDIFERAEREGWDSSRLAKALEIDEDKIEEWRRAYQEAKEILDAPTPVQAFRRGIRASIKRALEEGLEEEAAIERLITQICYRVADPGYLIEMERKQLSDYSFELREETEADREYRNQQFIQRHKPDQEEA